MNSWLLTLDVIPSDPGTALAVLGLFVLMVISWTVKDWEDHL